MRIYKKDFKIKNRKTLSIKKKSKIQGKKKENTILTKKKRKETLSWPRKKESNQDLDQVKKQVLRYYFFNCISFNLRRTPFAWIPHTCVDVPSFCKHILQKNNYFYIPWHPLIFNMFWTSCLLQHWFLTFKLTESTCYSLDCEDVADRIRARLLNMADGDG